MDAVLLSPDGEPVPGRDLLAAFTSRLIAIPHRM